MTLSQFANQNQISNRRRFHFWLREFAKRNLSENDWQWLHSKFSEDKSSLVEDHIKRGSIIMKGGANRNQGRKYLDGQQKAIVVSITLPVKMVEWLKDQPGSRSEIIRKLIAKEMINEKV